MIFGILALVCGVLVSVFLGALAALAVTLMPSRDERSATQQKIFHLTMGSLVSCVIWLAGSVMLIVENQFAGLVLFVGCFIFMIVVFLAVVLVVKSCEVDETLVTEGGENE